MLWAQPKPCVSSLGHGSHLVPPLEEVRYLQNLVNILFIKGVGGHGAIAIVSESVDCTLNVREARSA